MRNRLVRIGAVAAVFGTAMVALAQSGGPGASLTGAPATGGAPAESKCSGCHAGNAENSLGTLEILDAPALYRAGRTYAIRVRVTSSATTASTGRRWGFELTSIDASTGAGAGSFANIVGQSTQTLAGTGSFSSRRYVEQSAAGTGTGLASPFEWQVNWTAPSPGGTPVMLYAAAVAANGTGSTSGDWTYTTSVAAQDTVTGVARVSWGALKNRLR